MLVKEILTDNPYMEADGRLRFTLDTPDIAYDKGRRAQLKKVAELIEPNSEYTKAMVGANSVVENTIRYVIETLRQALLDEVKDATK